MGRLREKIGNMSIRRKIVFYMYVVLIPLLLVICIAVTVYRYRESGNEYARLQRQNINNLQSSLDIIEEDVRNLSLNLAINNDIRSILTTDDPEAVSRDVRLWQNLAPMRMVEDIIALKGYIKTLSVYPENGVTPYLRCMDASSYISTLEEISATGIYQRTKALLGKGLWVYVPHGNGEIYQGSRSDKLVLCRAVYNTAKSQMLGYTTIGISLEAIEKLCRNALQSEKEAILLYEKNGGELLICGNVDEEVRGYIAENMQALKGNMQVRCGKREIYGGSVTDDQWIFFKVVPTKGFFDIFGEIAYIPLLLLIGISLGILPLTIIISYVISKPLEQVCVAMGKFRRGDFEQQIEITTKDEIGEVASCFNQMVTDIRELINKNYVMVLRERESELAVLQAQINPHFLYNALDSIYWQAEGEGDEKTAESVYELAQLFRLVLGQGKSMVTVEMELQLLERYLEIQKLRFHEQMNYSFEVEPAALNVKIPKLILQPFVENAVVHGMQDAVKDFKITVAARMEGAFVKFFVRDNGVGMDDVQLRRIWEEDSDKFYSGQRIGRYAIKNVRERLALKYGENFELNIESRVGRGTLVTVCLPADMEEG
ncbi:HAMP domain protein [Marvinbryantia formatexigens DSM 14469]|uniref:histidine kinase n=1 Tax=Marvinbryantia formatexigens DSM 14469 TaxID=478749 RepID=C6LJK1_9FIRM|nr:histidine kinase [Marvinbryantia formatexigens]EET59124.1 HAMP domain protein [Marvinbryantia formatexigens DSM 14469]UWO26254.1 sensor histidine kinase [Marvinbryantia formatexigens DSM 14469]SDG10700.1 two-component system, sensor histidine kinase YesM [Marvinbryantia formatexigens]